MRCLITGVAGFVGTNLALRLLREGHQVVGVDSLSRKGSEINLQRLKEQFPDFHFIRTEIEDLPLVLHKIHPELVYHFAAQVAVTLSLESPRRDFMINAVGTFEVALAAHNMGVPVIYTSTNKVFGDNINKIPLNEHETRYDFTGPYKGKGIDEDFSIDSKKHTPYGCSKLVGDIYIREFGGIVNRCSCMYGENQFGIADQGWVSYFIKQKQLGNQITIFGNGKQVRDLVYIDDVINLLVKEGKELLAKNDALRGEVFNVGGGFDKTISLLELCSKLGIKPQFGDWRPADQKVFYCNISKAKKLLDWEPKVSIDEGIQRLSAWTAQHNNA